MNKFTYFGSIVSSTENDINTRLAKAWTASDSLSVIWNQTWPKKWNAVFSKQRISDGCTHEPYLNVWRKSLTAITQECCQQYWTSPGGITPQNSSYTATCHPSRKLSKMVEPGHGWKSGDEFISDILLWTPSHGLAKTRWLARTYIQ